MTGNEEEIKEHLTQYKNKRTIVDHLADKHGRVFFKGYDTMSMTGYRTLHEELHIQPTLWGEVDTHDEKL